MAFIGNNVQTQGFTPAIDYFNGDGTTVTFTLSRPVVSVAQMIVAIDNVIQNPSFAFTVSGNEITFTSAPLSGTNNIWVEYTSLITTYNAISQDPSVIGDITATGGYLSTGDFGNTFTDGTIVDYVTGNARITTGPADGITFYNGGTASRTALMAIDSSGNVGIGTTTPGSPLDIKSNIYAVGLNVRGRSPDNFSLISFSNSTGTPGSYIGSSNSNDLYLYTGGFYARVGIDSSGRVTKPNQPAFSINGLSTTIFNANTGASGYLNGGSANTNVGNCYDSTTGRFTAPVAGRYLITAAVLVNAGSGRLEGNVFVNGNSANFSFNGTGTTYDGACVTCILTLNANDYVTICRNSGVAYSNHGNNYFNGYLLG